MPFSLNVHVVDRLIRQPIAWRVIGGVQSGPLVRALMEKNLVKIAGREQAPGNPVQYGTTKEFLAVVGIPSLADLPKPEELD